MSAYNEGDLGSIPGSGRSPGEGNGKPLQYSCLENPMDRGAWWATDHGVSKSRTRLSDFTIHSSMYKSAVILFLSGWLFGLVLSPMVVLIKFIQVCISLITLDLGYLLLSPVLGYPQAPNPFNNHEISECWALLKKTQTCQTQEIIQIWWCPSTIGIMLTHLPSYQYRLSHQGFYTL